MDRRVDLTLNRDFGRRRRRGAYEDIPRSIFKGKNILGASLNLITNSTALPITMDMGTTTSVTTTYTTMSTINNGWYSYNNPIGLSYNNGEICDYCGRDITRLPWQREARGCLCKKCYKSLKDNIKRIPWK